MIGNGGRSAVLSKKCRRQGITGRLRRLLPHEIHSAATLHRLALGSAGDRVLVDCRADVQTSGSRNGNQSDRGSRKGDAAALTAPPLRQRHRTRWRSPEPAADQNAGSNSAEPGGRGDLSRFNVADRAICLQGFARRYNARFTARRTAMRMTAPTIAVMIDPINPPAVMPSLPNNQPPISPPRTPMAMSATMP